MKRSSILVACAASILCASSGLAAPTPLSAEFTYQGSLNTTGGAYTGLADMRFRLYDDAAAGVQVGATILIKNIFVDRGLFTVPIDFGVPAFNGENRWMEIDVSTPAGSGTFTTLAGRQKVTATPYSLQTRGLFTDSLLNVGVGTTSPLARLNVNGVLRVDDGEVALYRAGVPRLYTLNSSSAIVTNSTGSVFFVAGMGTSIDRSGFVELRTPSGFLTAILEGDNDNSDNGVQVGALRLSSEGTGAGGGVISVTNNDGRETFSLVGGGSGGGSTLKLFGATGASHTVRAVGDVFGFGGGLYTTSAAGALQFAAEPDFDGGGGYLFVNRSANGATGLVVDGNWGGTGSTFLSIIGNSSNAAFNMATTGNDSVVLPANSISSQEILDEPGVANIHANSVALTTVTAPFASRSITVPGPGYIVAFAQGDLQISHVAGTATNCNFGVSESSNSLPGDQDVQVQLPAGAAAGLYDFSASAHGLFQVAAPGTYTYFFNGARTLGGAGGSSTMFDIQLTLMYFPTSYGTIVSNLTSPNGPAYGVNCAPEDALLPMSRDDILAERDAEFARHNASVNNELAQMRQQMAQMQAKLDQITAQQASMRAKSTPAVPAATPKQGNIDMSMLPVVATPK